MPVVDRTPGNRVDANTIYFDAALRHQVGVRNLTGQQVNELLAILEKADQEITAKLRARLTKFVGRKYNPQTLKFKKLLLEIKAIRQVTLREAEKKFRNNLIELSKIEADFEKRMMEAALPFLFDFESVPSETLTALVTTRPFGDGSVGGRNLKQWFDSLEAADRQRITSAIQVGLFQGEGINAIVSRIAGTSAFGFREGALAMTRKQAEAIVRTAVNGISNTAREAGWLANADIIIALRWVSTLDGRTTAICKSRDGRVTPMGENTIPSGARLLDPPGARPPAHVGCRSVMTAIFSQQGILNAIGTRPFVRIGKGKRLNFRDLAREQMGRKQFDALSPEDRRAFVNKVKQEWASEKIGTVPANVTYQEWLKRQPADFQDEVLGKTKGKLFRTGEVTVDSFVTRAGNELTLKQLAQSNPTAFMEAGLELDKFL